MISEEGAQRQVAQGFKLRREQEPEPPERVLADFEALSDNDQMWADEMIHEWMKQTDPSAKRQRAHFDRPLHRRKQ